MKRMNTSLLYLLDRGGFNEIGAHPPVLLGWVDRVVVDPSSVRCLQDRVVEEEAETATQFEHPSHLGNRVVDVIDVFEHETCNKRCRTTRRRKAALPRRHDHMRALRLVQMRPQDSSMSGRFRLP